GALERHYARARDGADARRRAERPVALVDGAGRRLGGGACAARSGTVAHGGVLARDVLSPGPRRVHGLRGGTHGREPGPAAGGRRPLAPRRAAPLVARRRGGGAGAVRTVPRALP